MAEVTFTPLTDRGTGLLDQMEQETQVYPFRTSGNGDRSYAVTQEGGGIEGFDRALDRLDPDWREHLDRTK